MDNGVGQIMSAEEINSTFESEWVLVGDPEVEENLIVKRGKVLWHGRDKDDLSRKMKELQPRSAAILYTGKMTEEQALNPEGQSATYVQYSHARATRVLEKAPAEMLPQPGARYDFGRQELHETALLELIAKLPEEVSRAADAYKPVIIAMYCFELADAFNTFYHNSPILKAPTEEQVRARLALTAAAKQTIANALGLLGITAPDIM